MIPLDREQIESRYWRYSPEGIPIPGFLLLIGVSDEDIYQFYRNLLAVWRSRPDAERVLLPDTVEAEHRRRPILNMSDLRAAAARIEAPDYDLAPARAVAEGRLQAQRQIEFEDTTRRQGRWSQTIEARRELEFRGKNLPQGKTANILLMRVTLSHEPGEKS